MALLVGGAALLAVGQHAAPPAVPAAPPAVPAATLPVDPATPPVDPRLVVRPRTIRFAGALSNGLHLDGTLYPAYPGRNTVHLTVPRGTQRRDGAERMALSATMPGMAMRPIKATLVVRGHRYTGALALPMFGTYRVGVVMAAPGAVATGSVTLTLSLPGM